MKIGERLKIRRLRKEIFAYDAAEKDEAVFRAKFYEKIRTVNKTNFRQWLFDLIIARNAATDAPLERHLQWSERKQRFTIDRKFMKWAKMAMREIQEKIERRIDI